MLKHKWLILVPWLFCLSFIAPGQTGNSEHNDKSNQQAKINGCQLLPVNNIWNTPIDNLPVDANSQQYIDTIGANDTVHADFGSGLWAGGPIGIPYTTVPGTQEKVNVTFYYDDESDPGPYPIPPDAPIEGGSGSDGDRHVIVVDRDNCILYELYDAWPQPDGSWEAGSGAIYDLNSNALRPDGWTSADAAGLPILPGLVRYEEVASGEINHAVRFTAPQTRKKYIWPARHYASSLTGTQYPPMGQRFRLKAGFDISGFSAQNQVILKALKKYGMILADNGSSWFICGAPDSRWNNDDLHELHNVKGSDFEAVDESSSMINPNSGAAKQSVTPATITVTSPDGGEKWTAGTTQSVTWSSTGSVANVKIEYSTDNGTGWSTIISSTANDGGYSWKVPTTSSSKCKVRISEIDGDPSDTSDAVFSIITGSNPLITVTSPNGGENWTKGSTHNITWTSSGSVGNVKIELLKGGSLVLTISSSTANDGSRGWTVPGSLSAGSNYQIKISDASIKSIKDTGGDFTISDSSGSQPEIFLNRTRLNAGAVEFGAFTGPQTFWIGNSGTGALHWTISDNADWLTTNPSSGTDSGVVKVSINPAGLSPGTYTGTITAADPRASNSPQNVTVYLTVLKSSQEQPPLGSFDSPDHGYTVKSSIPVTGWALDDIEIKSVKIYRHGGGEMVYIGNAVIVEGARPDVEIAYPDYPYNYRAGWGYMLLTNFLPNNGNGTYTLAAVAADISGNLVTLGTRTIKVDNAHAVKPFGAIDTPTQGGKALGSSFINWGWVLTPQPNAIPTNGSTINVYVDGVKLGHPHYNIYRADIANLFPGYANSNGASGYFSLDTTAYSDGVHTIQWTASDNAGNTDGIGSRYFTIRNSNSSYKAIKREQGGLPPCSNLPPLQGDYPILVIKGYNTTIPPQTIDPDEDENITIELNELEPVEIHFPAGNWKGFQVIGDRFERLPIGSTMDRKKGIFYWLPPPGFLGEYELIFFSHRQRGMPTGKNITIKILPD